MKRNKSFLLLGVLLTLALSAGEVGFALAAPDPFVGAWESIDGDGSYQRLNIGGTGNHYNVFYEDTGATLCGLEPETGEPLYAAQARGAGTVNGNVLEALGLPVYCMAQPIFYVGFDADFYFSYDSSNDTLTDNGGIVWTRVASANPFVGAWESIDGDGSYQRLNIGGSGNHYNVFYEDTAASICGLDPETNEPLYAAQLRGDGTSSGNVLEALGLPLYCMAQPIFYVGFDVDLYFSYDSGSDTLDDGGIVWTRVGN